MRSLLFALAILTMALPAQADRADVLALLGDRSNAATLIVPKDRRVVPPMEAVGTALSATKTVTGSPRILYWTSEWCVPTCMKDLPNLIRLRDAIDPTIPIELFYIQASRDVTINSVLERLETMRSSNATGPDYSHDDLVDAIASAASDGLAITALSPTDLGKLIRAYPDGFREVRQTSPLTQLVDADGALVAFKMGWMKWDETPELAEIFRAFAK